MRAAKTVAQPIVWKANRLGPNVFDVTVPFRGAAGWEAWTLVTSDRHWDNPHSDLQLQAYHLDQAKERGASVLDLGDFFCAMQGKWDKRSSKGDIRPEHQNGNYLDSLVDTAAEWLQPWSKNIVMIASGNHEESIKTRHETDLIERLCALTNAGGRASIGHGGFGGWVIFRFRPTHGGGWQSVNLHYDHGYGGGGPVTRDTIQAQRRAVYLPDADIILSGHTHDKWVMSHVRARISPQGVPYLSEQVAAKCPTYKEEYGTGAGGWHCRRGAPPKPVGGLWIRWFWSRREHKIKFEITPTD
jgi:hypothetical protein